jgi:carbon-monoxide dehydrogenase medium subunit
VTDLDFRAPTDLAEGTALLAEHGPDAKVLAGGTALVLSMKQRLVRPRVLVSLQRVPGLAEVTPHDGGLRIGARATLRDLETSPPIAERLPSLRDTIARVATVRIRNHATIGGNLAQGDPLMDVPAVLMALDATVRLASAQGDRAVPLASFYVDRHTIAARPDEIITAVDVPAQPLRTATAYLKYVPRTVTDYPTVGVAARLTLDEAGDRVDDVRLALAGAGPTTLRAVAAEDLLRGRRPTTGAFAEVAATVRDMAAPDADFRGSAEYKREMIEVHVRRALQQVYRSL